MKNIHSTCADSLFWLLRPGWQADNGTKQTERKRAEHIESSGRNCCSQQFWQFCVLRCLSRRCGHFALIELSSLLSLSLIFLTLFSTFCEAASMAHWINLRFLPRHSSFDCKVCGVLSHKYNNYQNDNPETTQSMANGNKYNNSLILSDMQLWEKPVQTKEIANNWWKFLIFPHSSPLQSIQYCMNCSIIIFLFKHKGF